MMMIAVGSACRSTLRLPVLVTTLITLCLVGCGGGPRKEAPRTGPAPKELRVTRGALEDRFALTGELEAINSENLVVPRTPAWLLSIRWLAEEGSTVKKGDRVIEFDSSSFSATLEDKRLAVVRAAGELQSAVAAGDTTLAEKAMEVERKRAELEKAEVEASVPGDLYPRRVHQEKQLALAQKRAALAKAEDELGAHRNATQLEKTVKSVAATRAERELTDLYARLEELTVRAPRDGLVLIGMNRRVGRKFLVGDQAFPGWMVASLPNLGAMQVRARLSDVDDGAVRQGMRADCVLDAYPGRVFTGRVTQVSPVARADGQEATRRFFDVLVALDKPAPELMRPGMSMRVEVVRRRVDGALLVPRVAVRPATVPGKTEVHLTGGRRETVELQWCTELMCVVQGGVLEGAALAVVGAGKEAS